MIQEPTIPHWSRRRRDWCRQGYRRRRRRANSWSLLSPVPVFTSESTPRTPTPLIFLIPLPRLLSDFLSSFRSCYPLISFVLFLFIPVYPFLSNPFCSHATDNHVLTQPHVSLIAPPPFLRYPFPLRPLTPNSSCI